MSEKYLVSIAEGCFHHVTSCRLTVLLVVLLHLGPQRLAGRRGLEPKIGKQ